MPVYEPEVAQRLMECTPENELAVDLDALIDLLVLHDVSIDRLLGAIKSGTLKVWQYPLLRHSDVQRWLNGGMAA